jgi:hypothetical protein
MIRHHFHRIVIYNPSESCNFTNFKFIKFRYKVPDFVVGLIEEFEFIHERNLLKKKTPPPSYPLLMAFLMLMNPLSRARQAKYKTAEGNHINPACRSSSKTLDRVC